MTYGYGAETIQSVLEVEVKKGQPRRIDKKLGESLETGDEATIIKFVNQIIIEALKSRSTDIHIEPFENQTRIRFRIDGVLYAIPTPESISLYHKEIVSRIKIMSNLNIAEKRLPQDGRCKVNFGEDELDLRISILPSVHGETVNIRILNKKNILSELEYLGISEEHIDILNSILLKPHGIILVTGPTGSGKTTTLYCFLNKLNNSKQKIITIEDPIEYDLGGISQLQVHPKIGFSFSNGLRSMLRHDPDIMMVGEIRDAETAKIAVQIALTGHLVLSSVHTNDAVSTITRLTDMGIEPYLLASSLECIIAQRLVRLICNNCKSEINPRLKTEQGGSHESISHLPNQIFEGRGCSFCNQSGYMGRTGIYEILVINDKLREVITDRLPITAIRRLAIDSGLLPLREDGMRKVGQGKTSIEEVLRVTQETNHI
jgi:type II secretory ATPase GspE/PulE/Tfp pilus assembly ATPase PilB-like protein